MNPKPNEKLSLGAGFYVTIVWKGFFTQSQVLLSSIAAFDTVDLQILLHRISYRFDIVDCALQWFRS